MPHTVVVAVAAGDVVPGGIGAGGHAVGGALVFCIGGGHPFAHAVLQRQQCNEHQAVHHRQPGIDGHAQHDGVEYQAKEQLEVGFQLVDQLKEDMEGLIGQKGLDLLALVGVAKQPCVAAVFTGKAQHVAAKGPKARPLGVDPTDGTHHIRGGLGQHDPAKIGDQKIFIGQVLPGLDDQPSGEGGQGGLNDEQAQHAVERRAEQKTDELAVAKYLGTSQTGGLNGG